MPEAEPARLGEHRQAVRAGAHLDGVQQLAGRRVPQLGGAIGAVSVVIKQELLLPFIGGIFVVEALSVILQVTSFKLRRKRIFRMAPLHHHFELLGWKESKIIARLWISALVFSLFALTTLKLR